MMEYKRETDSETAKSMKKHGNLINPYYVLLAELEDKIESGKLVENNVVSYVNMARSNGKTLVDKALKYDELKAKIEQGTLKKEKTCTNISEMHPSDGFTCSECGISLEDYCEKEVDEENGDITYREYVIKYCPNCGAKVVE